MTVGMDIIKNCIETGTRELRADTLSPIVAKYRLSAGRAGATLVVQAIAADHRAEALRQASTGSTCSKATHLSCGGSSRNPRFGTRG